MIHDASKLATKSHLEVVFLEDIPVVFGDSVCKPVSTVGGMVQKELLANDRVFPPTLTHEDLVHKIMGHPHHTAAR